MRFKIKDFELNGAKKEVTAPGFAEAMFEYLPWPTLDLDIQIDFNKGIAKVIDNKTEFMYEVQAV